MGAVPYVFYSTLNCHRDAFIRTNFVPSSSFTARPFNRYDKLFKRVEIPLSLPGLRCTRCQSSLKLQDRLSRLTNDTGAHAEVIKEDLFRGSDEWTVSSNQLLDCHSFRPTCPSLIGSSLSRGKMSVQSLWWM